jgi:hypothetical protein
MNFIIINLENTPTPNKLQTTRSVTFGAKEGFSLQPVEHIGGEVSKVYYDESRTVSGSVPRLRVFPNALRAKQDLRPRPHSARPTTAVQATDNDNDLAAASQILLRKENVVQHESGVDVPKQLVLETGARTSICHRLRYCDSVAGAAISPGHRVTCLTPPGLTRNEISQNQQ